MPPTASGYRAVSRRGRMNVMEITGVLTVPDDEFHFSFARSGGPGGQNVNKVSSKAILHWNVLANVSLPLEVRARLRDQQANRITVEGDLVVQGQRHRDQAKNVEDCLAKLREMIVRAATPPKPRKKTKPSRGSKERRLEAKRQQSRRKSQRRQPGGE